MRVKKNKLVRRHVRFYKACCGFREPFKVLCDGNFVHAVLAARVGSLQESFPALLGAGTKVYVTRCVIGELRKLGEAFSGTVAAARRLEVAKCNHDPLLSAIDCIEAMVGKNNVEHFFVATQDTDLRRKLRKVEGGALIYLQNTGLILEQPSPFQQSYARLSEADRLHMAQREQNALEDRAKQKAAQVSTDSLAQAVYSEGPSDEGQQNQKSPQVNAVSRLKRQRAKGPNPLSQKKKQKTSAGVTIQQVQGKDNSLATESDKKSRRQRHRGRRKGPGDGQLSLEG